MFGFFKKKKLTSDLLLETSRNSWNAGYMEGWDNGVDDCITYLPMIKKELGLTNEQIVGIEKFYNSFKSNGKDN